MFSTHTRFYIWASQSELNRQKSLLLWSLRLHKYPYFLYLETEELGGWKTWPSSRFWDWNLMSDRKTRRCWETRKRKRESLNRESSWCQPLSSIKARISVLLIAAYGLSALPAINYHFLGISPETPFIGEGHRLTCYPWLTPVASGLSFAVRSRHLWRHPVISHIKEGRER